jgi:hypothetical protein
MPSSSSMKKKIAQQERADKVLEGKIEIRVETNDSLFLFIDIDYIYIYKA